MFDPFDQILKCTNCNANTLMVLHRRQIASGGFHYCWMCSRCNQKYKHNGRTWIARSRTLKFLTADQIDSLPVIPSDVLFPCVKCGAKGTELHHWAPKAIFGHDEAEQWPTDYLCLNCHNFWHDTINSHRTNETTP